VLIETFRERNEVGGVGINSSERDKVVHPRIRNKEIKGNVAIAFLQLS
jgi:hypothetical protein